ncbi:hypothetical protein N7470_002207 [Penicillium chermesinum]|nr:hypothetical protein N7470_002207 [Penicillium chermesinum]
MSTYTSEGTCNRVLDLLCLVDDGSNVLTVKMTLLLNGYMYPQADHLFNVETNLEPCLPLDPLSELTVRLQAQSVTQDGIVSKVSTLLRLLQDPSHLATIQIRANTSANDLAAINAEPLYILTTRFTNSPSLDGGSISNSPVSDDPDFSPTHDTILLAQNGQFPPLPLPQDLTGSPQAPQASQATFPFRQHPPTQLQSTVQQEEYNVGVDSQQPGPVASQSGFTAPSSTYVPRYWLRLRSASQTRRSPPS